MKLKKIGLPISLIAAIALPAGFLLAQDKDEAKPEGCASCKCGAKKGMDSAARFAAMDADSDGKVTEAELVSAHQKRVAEFAKQHFAGMDLDENGYITETELSAVSSKSGSKGGHRQASAGCDCEGECKSGACSGEKCETKKDAADAKPPAESAAPTSA